MDIQGAAVVGDEVVTKTDGLGQIKFKDGTRVLMGPSSRLRIDTLVFNSDGTVKDVTLSIVQGTVRFILGNSPTKGTLFVPRQRRLASNNQLSAQRVQL